MNPAHLYADGRPFRAPRSLFHPSSGPRALCAPAPAVDLTTTPTDWLQLWLVVQRELKKTRFARGTLRVYRQVLRAFRDYLARDARSLHRPCRPSDATPEKASAFLGRLADRHTSWAWLSVNICVLRTALDKLGGLALTTGLRTPKRPQPLNDILAPDEVSAMIAACPTIRDRLLIGLMYGCGLKVGETCRLRWADVDPHAPMLTVRFAGGTRTRSLPLPEALLPVLAAGTQRCEPDAFVFPGARNGRHLSERMAERVVRRAARLAQIHKEVCCTTLRTSYAVARLRNGASIRELQQALGHKKLETTLHYQRYIPPTPLVNPANHLPGVAAQLSADPAPADQPQPPGVKQEPPPAAPYPPLPPVADGNLELPFPHIANGPREFYLLLKTRLKDGFLALRRQLRRQPQTPAPRPRPPPG